MAATDKWAGKFGEGEGRSDGTNTIHPGQPGWSLSIAQLSSVNMLRPSIDGIFGKLEGFAGVSALDSGPSGRFPGRFSRGNGADLGANGDPGRWAVREN